MRALDGAAGPRVEVGVSPHSPYTVGPDLWHALAEHPDLGGRPWATHLAESPEETTLLETGRRPARRGLPPRPAWPPRPGPGAAAGRCAAWPPPARSGRGMVAAHCVQLEDGDAERLTAAGVGVAHCPQSNAQLRCGVAPLRRLVAAGAAVGLGSDSPGSAGAYDLRAEARACALVHAAAGEAPAPGELLRLATLGGAEALGLDHLVGSLAPGKRADLAAVLPAPGAEPGDPAAAVLDPRSATVLVMVDGRVVLDERGPVLIDAARVRTAASGARSRLC